MGRDSFIIQADVSKAKEVKSMFEEVKSKWGNLHILVNNAGVISYNDFEKLTEREWDRVLDTNLKGQFLCSQEAVRMMKPAKYGRIINIASISSGGVGIGFPQIAHYTASKGGVVGLTENMASDLGPYGVNVNAIAPGAIETDMGKMDEKTREGLVARLPKKRIGQPSDIGAAAAFLASDEADYITGVVLYVDGGWLTT
jgi:3-oxoacyl-[acyl-carrier protein] reductase